MNQTYTVKRGDTLYGISNQYGVSVTDLANANNISTNATLQIGQTLTIPRGSGTNPNTTFIYTVKSGDNLYSIARKYNTTVAEITKLNNLKTNNLSIGQQLKIPENYTKEEEMTLPSYINYTVKKGDSLYSIANKYNTTVDMIMKDNGLSNTALSIGQNLRIRIIGDNIEIEECFGEEYTPPTSTQPQTQNYIIKKGDSLYSIANKYNTSVSTLMSLNNLLSTNLSVGQQLKIPLSSQSTTTTYTVKSGDSLYSIAKKFNTTVDNIKSKNNLKSNLLTIGQKLVI